MVEDRQTIVLNEPCFLIYLSICSNEIFILILPGVASNSLGLQEHSWELPVLLEWMRGLLTQFWLSRLTLLEERIERQTFMHCASLFIDC